MNSYLEICNQDCIRVMYRVGTSSSCARCELYSSGTKPSPNYQNPSQNNWITIYVSSILQYMQHIRAQHYILDLFCVQSELSIIKLTKRLSHIARWISSPSQETVIGKRLMLSQYEPTGYLDLLKSDNCFRLLFTSEPRYPSFHIWAVFMDSH